MIIDDSQQSFIRMFWNSNEGFARWLSIVLNHFAGTGWYRRRKYLGTIRKNFRHRQAYKNQVKNIRV